MSLSLVVDILGWIGAVLLLYGYARVSSGKWTGGTKGYQVVNIAGSILFIINSGYHGAYPSVAVNVIWAAIALVTLVKIGRQGAGGRRQEG